MSYSVSITPEAKSDLDDGDELHIVLKITDDDIVITDEGHTMMWLSYEDFKFTPTRESMFRKIISQNCVR